MSLNSSLEQPEVDNQQSFGVPAYQSVTLKEQIVELSKFLLT